MADKTYKVGSNTYDIPEAEVQTFLSDFPDAVEIESFTVDKDTFDIPITERDSFLKDFPTAQPVKKKEDSETIGTPSQVSSEEQPPLEQPKEKEKRQPLKDLQRTFESSGLKALGGITAAPHHINTSIAKPLLKPLARLLGADSERAEQVVDAALAANAINKPWITLSDKQKPLTKKANEIEKNITQLDGDIWSNLIKGKDGEKDLGVALEQLGRGIIGSIPMLAEVAATAPAGPFAVWSTITATSAAQQYAETEGIGMSDSKRRLNSWAYGGLEALGELASAYIFGLIGKAFKGGLRGTLKPQNARSIAKGIAESVGIESSSEGITQVGQNITAILTGEDPNRSVFAGFWDAVTIGGVGFGFGGGVLQATASMLGRAMATDKQVSEVQENFKQQEVLINQLELTDVDPVKEALKRNIKFLKVQSDLIMDENYELASKLTPEQQNQVAELYSVWNQLQDKIDSGQMTEVEAKAMQKTVEGIKGEIKAIKDDLIKRLDEEKKAEKEAKVDEVKETQKTELDKLKEEETKKLDKVKDVAEGETVNKKKLDEIKEKYDTKAEEVKAKTEEEVAKIEEEYTEKEPTMEEAIVEDRPTEVNITKDSFLDYVDYLKKGGKLSPSDLIDLRQAAREYFDAKQNALYDRVDKGELSFKQVDPFKGEIGKEVSKERLEIDNLINSQPNAFGLEGDVDAPITYHFTDVQSVLDILNDNFFYGEGETSGLSTTTNKAFDHPELTQVQAYGEGNKPTTFADKGIRVDLDLQKLKEDGFRIRKGGESLGTFVGEEELRIGQRSGIKDASKYIKQIQVDRKIVDDKKFSEIKESAKKFGIPVVEKTDYTRPRNKVNLKSKEERPQELSPTKQVEESKPLAGDVNIIENEARKYNSAEEFGNAIADLYESRDQLISKMMREEDRNPTKAREIQKQIDEINESPLYKALENTNSVIGTGDESFTEDILGNRFSGLVGNIYALTNPATKQILIDFYNKATGIIKQPQEPQGVPVEPLSPTEGITAPPKVESVAKDEPQGTAGVKFKGKTYTSIEEVQDDFYDKKITFDENVELLEKVGKFEDGLKEAALKKSRDIGKALGAIANSADTKIKKKNKDLNKLHVKFFPINISQANTALWKQLVKVRDAAGDWIARRLQEGEQSQTDALRWVAKTVTNWYGGLGRTEKDILGKLKMTGTVKEFAPYEARQLQEKLLQIVNADHESLRRVRDALDPEIATEQLVYDDLTPQEQSLYDSLRELNSWVHETNYANGFIPTDTYLKFKDGDGNVNYIARMYDEYELPKEIQDFINKGNNALKYKLNVDIFKMRKEVDDWKKEHAIQDPVYLTAKRVMQTIQNVAIKEYMDQIVQDHPSFVRDIPKGEEVPKGFTQLSSAYRWGPLRNKAVANHIVEDFTGFFYSNSVLDTLYDAFKLWDRNALNQFFKKWHTVFNPFVQAGNFTGNMFFGSIAGINPVVLASKMPEAKKLPKENPDLYKEILKSGILGSTGITGDMTPITDKNKLIVQNVNQSQSVLDQAVEILGKVDDAATKLYQETDNLAKIAAYLVFREQGLTHEQSVRRTYDSFQNYATVGKTWDIASKTPLAGNKFIKFQADLQRILLNAVTTSPLTTVGTLMLISALGNVASKLSGEDDEEKKIRESRKGVAKIPLPYGMSVPLSFKVGKKEVNFARYLSPLYLYRYGESDADFAEVSKFLPFQFQRVPKPQLGETGTAVSWGDPMLGWIPSILTDRDFRGSSIQNPGASKYFNPNPTTEERIANVVNYVARSQVPFYKSFEDIADGITGRLDYYGRRRTWTDAILNNLVKIQEFNKPELKRYVEGNVSYLTNKFTGLSEAMGNSNAAFIKAMKNAEELGMDKSSLERLYREEYRKRTKRMAKSLKEQIPVMQEIERLVSVYKKWYPDDPFIQENFMNIESGKNKIFDIQSDIDLQKKYKEEYDLLKRNGLLRKPDEIPAYYNKKQLTEQQRKTWTATYWSEYIRQLDMNVGLTQEDIDKNKAIVENTEEDVTKPEPKKITKLDRRIKNAREDARKKADQWLDLEMAKVKK